jgi:hypothetical protein
LAIISVLKVFMVCPEHFQYINMLLHLSVYNSFRYIYYTRGTLLVAQLVEALRYKPEGRGFDSRWCHWNFSLT